MGDGEEKRLFAAAKNAGWTENKLSAAMVAWDVRSAEDLYAKFVATGRDAALFANAAGVPVEEFRLLIKKTCRGEK